MEKIGGNKPPPKTIRPILRDRREISEPPHYFVGRQAWIKQQTLWVLLSDIRDFGKEIKKNNRQAVFSLLEIVVGSDFRPQIVKAAKPALACFTSYQKNDWPFEPFGFSRKHQPSFFLGALFESLPPETAIAVFKTEFLNTSAVYRDTKAGRSMLRLSSADEAAKFMQLLKENTIIDPKRFLRHCQRNKNIREYPFLRYEVKDLKSAFEELTEQRKAIVLFARYMGMEAIPEKTMDKLRHDPYFRYCFYQLRMHSEVYNKESLLGKDYRESMLRILKDPDSMTDKDLYLGLYQYLSNFTAYLPGGYKAGMLKEAVEASASLKRIFKAADEVLKEKGLTEKAALLRAESKEEEQEDNKDKESFVKRAEFLKLALDIFNVLVERYKFDPQELWT